MLSFGNSKSETILHFMLRRKILDCICVWKQCKEIPFALPVGCCSLKNYKAKRDLIFHYHVMGNVGTGCCKFESRWETKIRIIELFIPSNTTFIRAKWNNENLIWLEIVIETFKYWKSEDIVIWGKVRTNLSGTPIIKLGAIPKQSAYNVNLCAKFQRSRLNNVVSNVISTKRPLNRLKLFRWWRIYKLFGISDKYWWRL